METLLDNRFESLDDISFSRQKCIRCNMCKFPPLARVESHAHSMGCPAYEHFQFSANSGGGMVIMANSLMEGRSTVTEAVRRTAYGCTLCGLCDVSCKYGTDIEVLDTLFLLRKHIYEQGHVFPQHQALLDGIRERNHPLQEHVSRQHQAIGLPSDKDADTLVWVGSHFGYDTRLYGWLLQMLALLQQAGQRYQLLFEQEPCAARAALEIGDWELFREQSRKVANAIRGARVARVICLDAEDYSTLRAQSRRHADIDVPIRHISEIYADLLNGRRLRPRAQARLEAPAWHDPCYLGRLGGEFVPWRGSIRNANGIPVYEPERPVNYGDGGVYAPPRELLRRLSAAPLKEFERRQEYAYNAGESGQARSIMPDFARATARRRLGEAHALGIREVVTECPQAWLSLAEVGPEFDIRVLSLTGLLTEALRGYK